MNRGRDRKEGGKANTPEERVRSVRQPVYQCSQDSAQDTILRASFPMDTDIKFDTGVDSTVNSPLKCTPFPSFESDLTHTRASDSKGTTIRSSINVQLASLLCLCV